MDTCGASVVAPCWRRVPLRLRVCSADHHCLAILEVALPHCHHPITTPLGVVWAGLFDKTTIKASGEGPQQCIGSLMLCVCACARARVLYNKHVYSCVGYVHYIHLCTL